MQPNFTGLQLPLNENGMTPKQNKRRSLLPQLSRNSSAEHKELVAGSEKNVKDDIEDPRLQNLSSVVAEPDKKAMPPPSQLSRPTSMRPPTAGGLGRAQSVRTHARNASRDSNDIPHISEPVSTVARSKASAPTSASRLSAVEPALKRSSTTRLPQSPKPAGTGPTRSSSIRSSQPHSRTSSTSTTISATAEKRSSISSARPPSINTTATSQAPSLRSPTSPSKPSSLQHSSRIQMAPPPRPGFTTFQQHYSPAKSALPKPPIPSARPPNPVAPSEEEIPMTFDVARQQMELLQLSLLHQASDRVTREYDASAQRKLGRKHGKLKNDYALIRDTELENQRVANLETLDEWCPDASLLSECLQILSHVYSDVSALAEPGSRYHEVVVGFERWTENARSNLHDPTTSGFLEPLPDLWRQAHASLALRLRSLQRELDPLPPAPTADPALGPPSSLEILLKSCAALIDGMLKELDIMLALEKKALAREKARVDEQVKALVAESEVTVPLKQRDWIPAWQKVA